VRELLLLLLLLLPLRDTGRRLAAQSCTRLYCTVVCVAAWRLGHMSFCEQQQLVHHVGRQRVLLAASLCIFKRQLLDSSMYLFALQAPCPMVCPACWTWVSVTMPTRHWWWQR
jgi:hypothetical protein